jgi:hypothetical protein
MLDGAVSGLVTFRVTDDGVTSSATSGPGDRRLVPPAVEISVSNEVFPLDGQSTRLLAYYWSGAADYCIIEN